MDWALGALASSLFTETCKVREGVETNSTGKERKQKLLPGKTSGGNSPDKEDAVRC